MATPPWFMREPPIFMLLRVILRFISEQYGCRLVQFWFDFPITLTKRCFNWMGQSLAVDGVPWESGITLERSIPCGWPGQPVTYDVILPKNHSGAPAGVVVYIHGGGFITTAFELYNASVTFLARRGFVVIGVDYPMAPHARFPLPQLTTMQVLRTIAPIYKDAISRGGLHIMGDSAGGNLALWSVLLCTRRGRDVLWPGLGSLCIKSNGNHRITPAELAELRAALDADLVPAPRSAVSIYGMCDRASCEQFKPWAVSAGFGFAWDAHAGRHGKAAPVSFAEALPMVAQAKAKAGGDRRGTLSPFEFPRTLLLCGDKDPLLASQDALEAIFAEHGCATQSSVYPGYHGFLGLPPGWSMHSCYENTVPAARFVVAFLDEARGTAVGKAGFGDCGWREAPVIGATRAEFPYLEPFGALVALQILVLMPLSLVLVPIAALLLFWHMLL